MHTSTRFSHFIILCLASVLLGSCKQATEPVKRVSPKELEEFESRAKDISDDLVYNNTYDIDNVVVADSLYEESTKLGSTKGKCSALRIKYYALIGYPEEGENFLKAVDEYIELTKADGDMEAYYDAMNAKLYYYIGDQKFMAAMMMVKEVMAEAEKSEDEYGLYFANYMMSTVYQNRGNFNMAIPYLLKAEECAGNDSTLICVINRELSVAYSNTQNFEESIVRALKSSDYATSTVHKAWGEQQYLATLFDAGKYDEFLRAYNKSVMKTGEYDSVIPDYMKAEIDMRHALCCHDYNKAREIVDSNIYEQMRSNDMLAIYSFQKDYKNALETKLMIDREEDSLQFNILAEDLSEMEAQLGNSQLRLQAEKLKTRNVRNAYISIIAVLLIIGCAGLLIFHRHRAYTIALQKKNEELDKALEIAEKASNVKSIFIKNMTHEFHTPLNHISGFAQVLADEDMSHDEESTREMSKAIVESSKHLTKILDNIVEVADHLSSVTELEDVESAFKHLSEEKEDC